MMLDAPHLIAPMIRAAKANRPFIPLEQSSPEAWLSGVLATSGRAHIFADRPTGSIVASIAGAHAIVLEIDDGYGLANNYVPKFARPAHCPTAILVNSHELPASARCYPGTHQTPPRGGCCVVAIPCQNGARGSLERSVRPKQHRTTASVAPLNGRDLRTYR